MESTRVIGSDGVFFHAHCVFARHAIIHDIFYSPLLTTTDLHTIPIVRFLVHHFPRIVALRSVPPVIVYLDVPLVTRRECHRATSPFNFRHCPRANILSDRRPLFVRPSCPK